MIALYQCYSASNEKRTRFKVSSYIWVDISVQAQALTISMPLLTPSSAFTRLKSRPSAYFSNLLVITIEMRWVWCDVIPMDACHVLLSRPWLFDRRVMHDKRLNTYSFTRDHKEIHSFPS